MPTLVADPNPKPGHKLTLTLILPCRRRILKPQYILHYRIALT